MRATLWLMGLFAAAVALALFAGGNQGTVTVFWPPHRVDLSVNLVLLLALLLFALLYGALRTVAALLELPRQARRWRMQQRERATNALLLDARVQLTAGRYLRARKAAESVLARAPAPGAQQPDTRPALIGLRTLANLTAAESAHALQDEPNRNRFLDEALAAAATPGANAELREAVLLRAAHWAVNTQDPAGALARLAEQLAGWQLTPTGTEGYKKAEVTLGGVDTRALSQHSMESKTQPGLYFIGEVVDVTGWLGGYNFQWAWASAAACAQAL